jgi:hypothetical protein
MCQLQVFILFLPHRSFSLSVGKVSTLVVVWRAVQRLHPEFDLSPPWQPTTSFQPAADCKFPQKNKYLQVVGERASARVGEREQEQCAEPHLSTPFLLSASLHLSQTSLCLSLILKLVWVEQDHRTRLLYCCTLSGIPQNPITWNTISRHKGKDIVPQYIFKGRTRFSYKKKNTVRLCVLSVVK